LTVNSGTLTVTLGGGATISAGASGTNTLTLSGTQTQINSALGTLVYRSNNSFSGTDILTVISTDNDSASDTDTVIITVYRDPLSSIVPGAQTVAEDATLAFNFANGNHISVTNVEGIATTRLTVSSGTLNISSLSGASIIAGANNSATLTLSGSEAQINDALATLIFTGNLNFNGSETLTVFSIDQRGSSATNTVAINITAVNDSPVSIIPAMLQVSEDTNLTFSGANAIAFTDPEGTLAPLTTFTRQVSVVNGTFTSVTTSGTSIIAGGLNTNTLTLSGTMAQVNTALATLVYRANLNFNGEDTLTLVTTDVAGNFTVTDEIRITVISVNDPPVFSEATGVSFTNGGPAVVLDRNVTISDPELSDRDNFAGTILTLQRQGGANSADQFIGSGSLLFHAFTLESGGVIVDGTTIGNFIQVGGALTITFNDNATIHLVNEAIRQIAYRHTGELTTNRVQIDWLFSDGNNGNQGTGGPLTASRSFMVEITSPATLADPPQARDNQFVLSGRSISGSAFSDDLDPLGQGLTGSVLVGPRHGSLVWSANGLFTYTVGSNFPGSDQFTYTASDAAGRTTQAVVKLKGFAYDAIRDQSVVTGIDRRTESFGNVNGGFRELSFISRQLVRFDSEPLLAGSARPGTTLIGRLHMADGSLLAENQTTANDDGDWVIQFHGLKTDTPVRVVIENVASDSFSDNSLANIQLRSDTQRLLQLGGPQQRGVPATSILSDSPAPNLSIWYQANHHPLSLL
ncbi:MAG: tandem-95 repeat protein, partial [Pirellula sp.]